MALTDKQIAAIHKLDSQTAFDIMHKRKRTVYQSIKNKKKMYFELSGHLFPAINDNQ